MSLFDNLIEDIKQNKINKIPLQFEAKIIHEMYKKYLSKLFFSTNKDDVITFNDVNNILKPKIFSKCGNIVKLLFSSNKHLYVSHKLLLSIDYFKNMMDNYVFNDEHIVEIPLCKEIYNYDVIITILTYINEDRYDDGCVTFQDLYNEALILDYMGPMYSKGVSMMRKTITNTVYNYDNLTLQNCNNLYDILNRNDVLGGPNFICRLWEHIIDLDDNVDQILSSTIFKNLIINTYHGSQFVLKHEAIQYYCKILDTNNYKIIIDRLLDQNDVIAWNIIMECTNYKNLIFGYLEINIDKITDKIFEIDVDQLSTNLLLKIVIKFKKYEYINSIGNKLLTTYDTNIRRDFCKFMDEINGSGVTLNSLYTTYFASYGQISYSYRDKLAQIDTFYPLVYNLYNCVGYYEIINNPQQYRLKKSYKFNHDYKLYCYNHNNGLIEIGCLKDIIVDYETHKNDSTPIIQFNKIIKHPNIYTYVYIQEPK